ncbi:MAG TPA: VWA domain-containing protein [Candidatus Angelobacter sp.]|nr:VWA domain-containing protein [Candidatus Angelobacter sp.]
MPGYSRPVRLMVASLCAIGGLMHSQTASSASQDDSAKSPFTLKTATHLVLVDVVATDGKGKPIIDLKAEDFLVTEDGHPQSLRSFSFQRPAVSNDLPQTPAPQLPPGVVTNIPLYKKGDIWNVIVLDALNSPMLDQSSTRQQLLKVINKIPNQPAAIYILSDRLRLLQDFSTDPAALKRVIAGLNNKGSALLDNAKGGHEAERYDPVIWAILPASAKAAILRYEGEGTASRTRDRLQLTLDALNAIAHNLKSLPGRKNLIWVSEGFPFSIEPGTIVDARDHVSGRNYNVSISSTANALFDSQIAIYPIDSRGIITSDVYDPASRGFDAIGRPQTQIGLTSTVSEENNNLNVVHSSMQEIAERTGGRAFYNRNEIGGAIIDGMNDGTTYYTLAYSPDNHNWNGKFRRIGVKSKRPGVKLRYRLGYFAIPPGARRSPQEQATAFAQAMDISSPVSTAVLFQARVIPPSEKTKNHVVVNYLIPAAGLSFEEGADKLQHASVNCSVEVFSSNGEVLKKDGANLTAALQPDVYAKVLREGFPCQEKLALPAGEYTFRLGVRDNATGMIGTADAKVTVASEIPQQEKQ